MLDLLDKRDSRTIKDHFFTYYSLADRQNVETVIIDMNAGIPMSSERCPHKLRPLLIAFI
ncbi:hypothetical protein [Amphibacillus sediminis]|uniref:hypothetical protein n=1 Tax=Amphibacillus sediminis TaxID=360185 RepID=UPI0012EE9D25